MNSDEFRNVSTAYGLDSQVLVNFYKAFASYFGMPKESFETFKNYHEPYKDKTIFPVTRSIEINTVDHIISEPYIEKVPFPAKVREHSIIASVVNKSTKKAIEPDEQITVEPAVAMVKDLTLKMWKIGKLYFVRMLLTLFHILVALGKLVFLCKF